MNGVGRLNHKRNKEKQKAQKKVDGCLEYGIQWLMGFFNHKSHKRKKKKMDGCWGRKAKSHKRKKRHKAKWRVLRIRNALARSATKAPKVKKT